MRRALAAILALLSVPALAAIETTTITGTVYAPDGSVATGGSITCALTPTPGRASDGTNLQVVASRYVATISGSGTVSFTLVPNDVISPAGTVYACTYTITGPLRSTFTESWSVTTAPDPVSIGSIARVGGPTLTLPSVSGAAGTIATITGIGGIYGDSDFTWDATANVAGVPQGLGLNLDADGSAEARLKGAGIYGETSARSRPCWDVGGAQDDTPDGTCDIFFDDTSASLVRANGTPAFTGPITLLSVWMDVHETAGYQADHDWTVNECKTYGVPCGFNYQKNANNPSWGFQAADFQTSFAAGMSIGSHSTSHCSMTLTDIDFSPSFGTQQYAGRYAVGCGAVTPTCVHTGTVQVVEGASTLVGTGTTFKDSCNDNTAFTPPGARIFVDTDNDGTVETNGQDYEGNITAIGSTTSLTLDPALRSDQDGDATSGETLSGRAFDIFSSPQQWREELRTSCQTIETAIGNNYRCLWSGAPGGWIPVDAYETFFAASDTVTVQSGSAWDQGTESESAGAPSGSYFDRFHVSSDTTWTGGLETLVDQAIKSKRSIFFSGHIPQNAAGGSDSWKQATFSSFLQACRTYAAQGKALCVDPVTATQLMRAWQRGPEIGQNLLGNSDFDSFATNWDVRAGNVSKRWPWEDVDADVDINGTAQLSYDGTNQWLTWQNDGNDAEEITQMVRLSTGYYQAGLFVRLGGVYSGTNSGVRVCIDPVIQNQKLFGTTTVIIPTTWHQMYDNTEAVNGTAAGGGNCSPFVTSGNNGKEREILGWFYVPPELDGTLVNYRVDVWDCDDDGTAGDCGSSPVYLRDATLAAYIPQSTDSRYGGYHVVPRVTFSGFPANAADADIGAFNWYWHPQDGGQGVGTANNGMLANPNVDALQFWTVDDTVGPKRFLRVGKIGVNNGDTWRASGSPWMALGYASGTTRAAGCYAHGQNLNKTVTTFSGGFCARSTAEEAIDILTNAATGQLGFKLKAVNHTGVATEINTRFSYGGDITAGNTGETNLVSIWGDGTLHTRGALKLGTDATEAVTTGTVSLCIRRTTCTGVEQVWFDFDCSGTLSANDVFLASGATTLVTTCAGGIGS